MNKLKESIQEEVGSSTWELIEELIKVELEIQKANEVK
jgi:hypothetical protein